jgi:hypothetical protein
MLSIVETPPIWHCTGTLTMAVNSLPHSGVQLGPVPSVIIITAICLLIVFLIARALIGFVKRRNLPLTPSAAFRTPKPQAQPAEAVRPRLTRLGYVAVIFAVVFGALGAGLTYLFVHKLEAHERLAREGKTITATVLSASKSHHNYRVRYEFEIDGRTYQGTGDVPLRSVTNARKSKELDVSYLPADPTTNSPAAQNNLPMLLGLIVPGLMDLSVVVLLWQLRRNFVLAKMGRLTTGIVVWMTAYGTRGSSIYYDFMNDRGEVARGYSSVPFTYTVKDGWGLGSSVQVLYLPGDPQQNALQRSMRWQG